MQIKHLQHSIWKYLLYSIVGIDLIDFDDFDGYGLKTCYNPGTLLNELFVKKYT